MLGSEGLIGKRLMHYISKQGDNAIPFDVKRDFQEDLRICQNSTFVEKAVMSDFVFFLAFDVGGSKYLSKTNDEFIFNNLRILTNTFIVLKDLEKPYIFASSQMAELVFSDYGNLKAIGEKLSSDGLVARLWNVYGDEPVGEKSHVIPDFIYKALVDKEIRLNTDGKEKRQFLYVDDCAKAFYTMYKNYDKFELGSIFDITSFEWITIYNLALKIGNKLNVPVIAGNQPDKVQRGVHKEPHQTEILNYWKPETTLDEGLDILITEQLRRL